MPNERVTDLIQRDLDGETSPAERGELQQILSSDADARDEHEAMRDVVQQLDSIEHVEPPANFKASVMERVRRAGRSSAPKPVVAYDSATRRRSLLRVAYAAAASLVVGIVISSLFFAQAPALRPIDAGGAMTPADRWKLVAKETVTRGGIEANVEVKRNGNRVAVLTRLNAATQQQIDIRWQPAVAPLEAVAREGGKSFRAFDGGITIDAAGKTSITAIVNEQQSAVNRIAITTNGSQVLELKF